MPGDSGVPQMRGSDMNPWTSRTTVLVPTTPGSASVGHPGGAAASTGRATPIRAAASRTTTASGRARWNTRVRLQMVPASGDEAWSSSETVVDVAGAPPAVRYSTFWHKRFARPPHAVTLSFASDERPATVGIVVAAQAGQVMP